MTASLPNVHVQISPDRFARRPLVNAVPWYRRRSEVLAWCSLVLLFAVVGPLFIRMPLCCDVMFFDACARCLLTGGLLYRDVWFIGSPTTPLLHAGARSVVGWTMEAIHGVDLLIVSTIVWILVSKMLPVTSSLTRSGRIWVGFILLLFYLGTSEWCHCQPDPWMLLPAAAALCLRCRQVGAIVTGAAPKTVVWRAVLEGALWGWAFSMKPFVGLAALGCLAVTAVVAGRAGRPAWKRLALDGGGLLLGGLLVGASLLSWIYLSGNWSYFRENVRSAPGYQEYYMRAAGYYWDTKCRKLVFRLWPWSLVHLLAVPVALVVLVRSLLIRPAEAVRHNPLLYPQAMLAACYLAWLTQANFIQHQFDYHLVPPVMLALSLIASQDWLLRLRIVRLAVLPVLLIAAVAIHPLLQWDRLSTWARCWRGDGIPELRDRLGSLEKDGPLKDEPFLSSWVDLDRVAQFLRQEEIQDGELTCWSNSSLALYSELRIRPSNRYVMIWAWLYFMPNRAPQVIAEARASGHRFIVVDLEENVFIPHNIAPHIKRLPSDVCKTYPWDQPIVFRAGRYLVLRAARDDPGK